MVIARSWRIKTPLAGTPTIDNYELVSEELGDLKNGEILTKTLFITVDPYLRIMMSSGGFQGMGLPVGAPIPSQQVAKVIESRDEDYPVGTILLSRRGWCDHAKLHPKNTNADVTGMQEIQKALDIGDLSPSLLVGACGMPGVTAYWGLLDICKVMNNFYEPARRRQVVKLTK